MKIRNLIIIIICLAITCGLFVGAYFQQQRITNQRKELKLVSNEPLENAPPSLAFATVAMGAFRGLVADILWMRADALKEKGQFFDAKQLAEWITVLQPRFASVWEFQSWNMAYNISVAIPASQPQERWRWVRNGYELIRDKGLVINPKSIKLYRQLAWIFQHKMGGVTDDAHLYYKLQLAVEIQNLLGQNPSKEFFDKLANAPQSFDEVMQDSGVVEFINALEQADDIFADKAAFCGNYLAARVGPGNFSPKVFDVIDSFRGREDKALEKFDIFARAYQLRNYWKMDPVVMIKCNNLYGPVVGDVNDPNANLPLEWRHPDSHAIYWAEKGFEVARTNKQDADELNADRIIFHSLQNLYRYGKIFIYDEPVEIAQNELNGDEQRKISTVRKSIFLRPDLRMFDSYNKYLMDSIERYSKIEKARADSIKNGHRNMLSNAVLSFYQAGNQPKALEVYNLLRKIYGAERPEFRVSLVEFCRAQLQEELQSIGIHDAVEMIVLMLREAYFRYAVGDDDEAAGREQMVMEVYEKYQKEFDEPELKSQGLNRVMLPSMARLRFNALIDFMSDPYYPQQFKDLMLNRIKVEKPQVFEQLQKESEIFKKEIEKQQQNQENQ